MEAKTYQQKQEEKQKAIKKAIEETKEVKSQFTKRVLDLATSGFGLVSALAWNEVIKEMVNNYIMPLFGQQSGLISLVIYAIFVTFLAVLVTYNLNKLVKIEEKYKRN